MSDEASPIALEASPSVVEGPAVVGETQARAVVKSGICSMCSICNISGICRGLTYAARICAAHTKSQ